MSARLHILLISDNPTEAAQLAVEISDLFEGSQITTTTTSEAVGTAKVIDCDLLLVTLATDDSASQQLVNGLCEQAAGRPIIVILPTNADIRSSSLGKLDNVYCLAKGGDYANRVTLVIDEILREPSAGGLDATASVDSGPAQAKMIRTAAGTLAHEINNPLMAILGISELILNDTKGRHPDVAHKVTMIRRSAERIESTLKRLARISEPVYRQTASGAIIDPEQSQQVGRPAKTRS
jgi:signal transduction histidine kinase